LIFINDFRGSSKIPDVKYDEMFKNYITMDKIFDKVKSIHFDVDANTCLKVNILLEYR